MAVLPREEPGIFLYETVKALKYPTAAGAATDVLLDALRDIDANAPGKEAGLEPGGSPAPTRRFLDAPPECPEPPPAQQDLACPDGGARSELSPKEEADAITSPPSHCLILRWEGGYVNHPADPGGATNKGVIQRVYDDWRTRQGLPKRDVRQLEDAEMHAIYEAGYWLPPRCDLLQRQLDLVQFDTAVNMGVGRAVRMLQGALGCEVDGDFGPATRRAAEACSLGTAIKAYCDAREAYYRRLAEQRPKMKVFLKGWLNRLNALRAEVGLPGYEAAVPLDFGDTGYVAKIPDLGENREYDL